MTRARAAAAALMLLFAATLGGRALAGSAAHRFPVYDEAEWLRLAHAFVPGRGLRGLIAAHLDGSYREENHNPLFVALLIAFLRGDAADFPRAKLLTLASGLLLIGAAAAAGRERGPQAALLCAGWTALSPLVAYYAHSPVPDLLFTALFALAIARARGAGERPAAWAAFGLLAGAAWLAKGDGHFLLLAPLAVALSRRGRGFWRSPAPWAAGMAFAAAGSILLWRNSLVWGDPFHHLGQKLVWLDDGTNFVALRDSPRWAEVGPLWYLRRHTLARAAGDAAWGCVHSGAALCRAFAVGPFGDGWELALGLPLLAAALLGLARAWRRGERDAVLATSAPCAALWLAFAWLAKRTPAFPRYDLPLAAALLPFGWDGLEVLLGRARPWAAGAAAALACAVLLTLSRSAWTRPPMSLWSLPPFWPPTSAWLRDHAPEGYLADYRVFYSAWDAPPDRRHDADFTAAPRDVLAWAAAQGVRHAVVDLSLPPPPATLGPADASGPTSFLGWPRCYRAPVEPNPLVVYGADCRGV